MAWIKRNLFFTIGGAIAVLLLCASAYYNFKSWRHNRNAMQAVSDAYTELENDYNHKPSPGNEQLDNIKAAQEQEQELRKWIEQAKGHFQTAPPIPNPENGEVTTEQFAGSLRKTIQDLQQQATNLNVGLPPDYSFSFAAERNLVTFTPGSLNGLASHLGDIKALCNILFNAKINALDSIQREMVSDNDTAGPQSDYLPDKTVTNTLSDITYTVTPYIVTFRCFSSDLATVLSSMASSDYCFIVKAVNVMPAGETQAAGGGNAPPSPTSSYTTTGPGGVQIVLDEKLLQVTLAIEVVKLVKQ